MFKLRFTPSIVFIVVTPSVLAVSPGGANVYEDLPKGACSRQWLFLKTFSEDVFKDNVKNSKTKF